VHRRLAPNEAIRVGQRMEEFAPYWYEEPVDPEDLAGPAEVRRRILTPVVNGEALYSKAQFAAVFAQRAADILNPDVCNCGGILALKEIAAMAEPWHVAIAPHNYNSTTIGLASTLHVSACTPNFLITEYFVNFEDVGREISNGGLSAKDGAIALPTAAGLGIELDEAALRRRALQGRHPASVSSPTNCAEVRWPGDMLRADDAANSPVCDRAVVRPLVHQCKAGGVATPVYGRPTHRAVLGMDCAQRLCGASAMGARPSGVCNRRRRVVSGPHTGYPPYSNSSCFAASAEPLARTCT
jgi:hypothetical protein